jgi:hypothetical protein
MGWRGTLLLRGWLEIFFGEHGTHVVSDLSDVIVVIHPTAMHRELLQIGLGFTVALQGSLFAWPFGYIRMDRRAKNSGRWRSTLPMTCRIVALLVLEADFMVRKDRVKMRGREPFFLEFVATPRAEVALHLTVVTHTSVRSDVAEHAMDAHAASVESSEAAAHETTGVRASSSHGP